MHGPHLWVCRRITLQPSVGLVRFGLCAEYLLVDLLIDLLACDVRCESWKWLSIVF